MQLLRNADNLHEAVLEALLNCFLLFLVATFDAATKVVAFREVTV
jgi:hypothetical protein